jgi:hypothetical protein
LLGTGTTFGVFLHHFVGSDAPTVFHDHPWTWGLSLVLRGGYIEERCANAISPVTRRALRPGRVDLLRVGVFHRVELRAGRPAWTLFVHARKVGRGGFLDRVTGAVRSGHRRHPGRSGACVEAVAGVAGVESGGGSRG